VLVYYYQMKRYASNSSTQIQRPEKKDAALRRVRSLSIRYPKKVKGAGRMQVFLGRRRQER
jgi:hypothetical protein